MTTRSWLKESWHSVERPIFLGEITCIATFQCDGDHPLAKQSGPTRNYLFTFPRRSIVIQHDGGRPFVAGPNVIPLYNAGQQYTRRPIDPRGGVETIWFAVAPEVLLDAALAHDARAIEARPERMFRRDHVACSTELFRLHRHVLERAEGGHADSLEIEEQILELLGRILSATETRRAETLPPASRERVEHAKLLLARNLDVSVPMCNLARATETSVYHLCRIFRRETGLSLREYRLQLRLRQALDEVLHSGDLLETALRLGFNSHSHFTAAFRTEFGVTPSEFRRRGRLKTPQAH